MRRLTPTGPGYYGAWPRTPLSVEGVLFCNGAKSLVDSPRWPKYCPQRLHLRQESGIELAEVDHRTSLRMISPASPTPPISAA